MGVPLAALAIRPPEQQPNLLDQYAKVAQLRQMQQEAPLRQQALQQNVQAGAQDIQMKQQQMKDQQAVTKAMQGWDGKDLDELPSMVLKQGGSAQAVFGLKNSILDQKEKLSKVDAATLANTATKNDQVLGKLQAVTSDPDDSTLPQRITSAAQDAVKSGLIDPQHAQQLQQMTANTQDPKALRQQLDIFEKSLMGQKEIFAQEQKSRETKAAENTSAAKVQEATNATTRLNAELPGGSMQPVEQKELGAYLAKNPGKTAQDFAAWKASLAPQANVNVQMAGGGKGGPLTDATIDALAAPGAKLKLSDVLPPRAPLQVRQAAINQVQAKYPDFATSAYDIEKGVEKSGASGDIGKNLTTFNTAIEHSKQLQAAVDALDNTDVRPLNKITNELGFQTGSDKQTNFNVVKSALAGEISKVFKGGQATDAEIKEVEKPFDDANSPAQLKGAIQQAIRLMNSKRDALKEQYNQGLKGKANFGDNSGSSDNSAPQSDGDKWAAKYGGKVRANQ